VSLIRHLPKRGFSNYPFRVRFDVVNLDVLEAHFDAGAEIRIEALKDRGILDPQHGRLKVLGGGSLTKSFRVVAYAVSESARKKIEAAGGTVEVLGKPKKKRFIKPVAKAPEKAPEPQKAKKEKAAAPKEKAAGAGEGGAPKEKQGGGKPKGKPGKDESAQ
jgi:hypothetical protein